MVRNFVFSGKPSLFLCQPLLDGGPEVEVHGWGKGAAQCKVERRVFLAGAKRAARKGDTWVA
jgi:hypothetical protein